MSEPLSTAEQHALIKRFLLDYPRPIALLMTSHSNRVSRAMGLGMDETEVGSVILLAVVEAAKIYIPGRGVKFATLVSRVAANAVSKTASPLVRDEKRRDGRRVLGSTSGASDGSADITAGIPDHRDGNPHTAVANREQVELINAAIQHLPEREAAVMRAIYSDDLDERETAERVGAPVCEVRRIKDAALRRIRRQMGVTKTTTRTNR